MKSLKDYVNEGILEMNLYKSREDLDGMSVSELRKFSDEFSSEWFDIEYEDLVESIENIWEIKLLKMPEDENFEKGWQISIYFDEDSELTFNDVGETIMHIEGEQFYCCY